MYANSETNPIASYQNLVTCFYNLSLPSTSCRFQMWKTSWYSSEDFGAGTYYWCPLSNSGYLKVSTAPIITICILTFYMVVEQRGFVLLDTNLWSVLRNMTMTPLLAWELPSQLPNIFEKIRQGFSDMPTVPYGEINGGGSLIHLIINISFHRLGKWPLLLTSMIRPYSQTAISAGSHSLLELWPLSHTIIQASYGKGFPTN